MLYGTECWTVKHQHVHKMGVAEMRMLRGMCGHTRKDKIGHEDIREVHGRRGRGRPRKTLEETLRKDLEYLDRTEDMTQNRAQWRSRIHIADPT
ncbi:hypothetical protein ACFX2B_039659 [Malus domestica]